MLGNQRTQVCYDAFLSLLAVTDKQVKRLRGLAKAGKSPCDKRGKSESANKFSTDKLEIIRNHIESFPTKLSHYAGKAGEYLDARFCTKALYRMLIDKNPGICSPAFFYDFFYKKYNIQFGRPKIDCCLTYEELNVKLTRVVPIRELVSQVADLRNTNQSVITGVNT